MANLELFAPPASTRIPQPADHVALRALIKYMSSVLAIPYKSISQGTTFDESSVKNYTNDKSSRSVRAKEMYQAFSGRCAEIMIERTPEIQLDDFVVQILRHLFGDEWLELADIRPPANHHGQPIDDALGKWLGISQHETEEVELRYKGLWRCFRASSHPNAGEA